MADNIDLNYFLKYFKIRNNNILNKHEISNLSRCVVDTYNSGASINSISIKYLLDRRTIIKILKSQNVTIENRPAKLCKEIKPYKWFSKEDRDKKTIEYYNQGYGAFVIGKALNIGKKTVYRILHNNGISTKDKIYRKEIDIDEIVKCYNNGKSLALMAKEISVDTQTLINRMKEKEIKLRSPKETLYIIPFSLRNLVIDWYKSELSTFDISKKLKSDYNLSIHPNNIQRFIHNKNLMRTPAEARKISVKKYKNINYRTDIEKFTESILIELDIKYEWQFPVDGWPFDFKVNNILIECQGNYWHSLPQRRQRDEKKYNIALKHGYKVCYIWRNEMNNKNLIINRIKNHVFDKPLYDFKRCDYKIIQFNDCKEFLNKYHYQGAGRAGSLNIGFFNKNKLIGVCIFGHPVRLEVSIRYNLLHQEVYELIRLCILPSCQAKNFASWMIAKSRKIITSNKSNIKLLVSFADTNYGHEGVIYKADNWELDGKTSASYWYVSENRNIIHKKTIWERAKKNNTSEAKQSVLDKLKKVHARPKNRYIYKLSSKI